jgi:hypothetical protein
MKAFLDDQPIELASASLADAVRRGAAMAEIKGRIVIQAEADGAAISDERLASLPDDSGGVSELRMRTADPSSMVRVALMDAAEMLDRVGTHQEAGAKRLHAGDIGGAMEEVSAAVGVWQLVRDVFEKSCAVLRLDPEQMELAVHERSGGPDLRSVRVSEKTAELAATLGRLKESLEAQDWSALADTLEYDLGEQAKDWVTLLRLLSDQLRDGASRQA